jgi:hypothetical protein
MNRIRHLVAAALVGAALAACSAGTPPPPTHAPTQPAASQPGASQPRETQPAPTPSESAAISEIDCDLGGHDDAYHIHSLVVVKVDGQVLAPPANIGISNECMYWVHTHASDGIVHVEAPANVNPTLGDVLYLWEESYPDDAVLAAAREAIAAGEVTVNDQPISSDPLDLVLADQMRIVLGS